MKFKILVLFSLFSIQGIAQNCECAPYRSLLFFQNYSGIFPPASIKAKKIKEIAVYSSGKETGNHNSVFKTEPHKELIFKFDNKGWVSEVLFYNTEGRLNIKFEINRNINKQISSKKITFFDASQNTTVPLSVSTANYFYDSQNRRIRSVEVTKHKNRTILGNTVTTYDDKKQTSEIYYSKDGKLSRRVERAHNKNGQVIHQQQYNPDYQDYIDDENRVYNQQGQLITITNNDRKMGLTETSCPDRGNYRVTYEYEQDGILSLVQFHFDLTVCTMKVKMY